MIDEVGASGSLPTIDLGKELLVIMLVSDEVPVELGRIIPVFIGIEGESSEGLKVSVMKA